MTVPNRPFFPFFALLELEGDQGYGVHFRTSSSASIIYINSHQKSTLLDDNYALVLEKKTQSVDKMVQDEG